MLLSCLARGALLRYAAICRDMLFCQLFLPLRLVTAIIAVHAAIAPLSFIDTAISGYYAATPAPLRRYA